MINNWKIDLDALTAERADGFKIKKNLSVEQEAPSAWIFEKGVPNDEILREGILCFNHHYAKSFLKYYLVDLLSFENIVEITNKYIKDNSYGDFITTEQLTKYMADEDLFPINTISLIRGAIYFYKKNR